ncbi:MAG: O-Antigen ligase [Parcubacteria bacterium OLB19]|nr:MAG: O-Antigen ligase [Parcubacteria bacterium OLB19]
MANDYFFPYITGKNFDFRIIVELVFFAWIVLALADAKYRPKFSWLISAFGIFLIVMFFANLLGQHPHSSFWSNFERMDGYVTLVHVFLYTLVLGSVLTTKKLWGYYLHTTLFVAFIVSLYGLAQFAGVVEGVERTRVESYLGNAAYLAIYMLFHIFIVFWLFVESKVNLHRVIYGLLSVMFIFTLIETGTRGTVLGLAVGIAVMVAYIAVFGAKYKEFQRVAIGAFVFLLVGASVFVLGKDSDFIQNNPNLARIANINFEDDLKVRGTIWGMAWDGVQERPVLGWGQSNFNYIFNEKYQPFLFDQEQWFDRSHNIIMDWLVAGGFLGLIAYLSIFVACLYYLIIVPLIKKDDETFTVLERAVLLGILAGYFTHNLVVFDNIISYIFFAVILALIHSRAGKVVPSVEKVKVEKNLINQFVAPVAGVLAVALIYTINIPGMQAAGDIIDGYRFQDPNERLAAFERALARDSFAHQEITEQLAQQTMSIMQDPKVSEEIRTKYMVRSEEELKKLVEEKPEDARIHVFFGSYYRSVGNLEEAAKQMQIARELSPKKQSIIAQQGVIAYSQGNVESARDYFKEAFLLDERNLEAREYYAALLFANGEGEAAKALVTDQTIIDRFALNDFLVNAANSAQDNEFLAKLYESRVAQNPELEQNWVSLSFLYYQMGNKDKAIETLNRSAEAKPSFAKMASCFADNIKAGREPETGCKTESAPQPQKAKPVKQ